MRQDPSLARPTWHRVYYLLAAINFLTLAITLYLTYAVTGSYRESARFNEEWSRRLDAFNGLERFADALGMPGSNAFSSRDVPTQRVLLKSRINDFNGHFAALRAEAVARVAPPESVPFLKALDDINGSTMREIAVTERIFSALEAGRPVDAQAELSALARSQEDVNHQLSKVPLLCREFQQEHFVLQEHRAQTYRRIEYAAGGVAFLLVIAVLFHGFRLYGHFKASAEGLARSHQILKHSEERFRSLSAASPVGIAETDEEGRVLYANPRFLELSGWTSADNRAWFEIVHSAERPACQEQWMKSIQTGQEFSREFSMLDPRGETRWISTRSKSIPTLGEGAPDYITTYEDVTSTRQRHDREVQQLQKMEAIGRLAGGVAHDFNNLLTVISGFTELSMSRLTPGDTLHSELQEVAKAAARGSALTRQLLAFSRKQVIQPRVFDLNNIILDIEKMVHRMVGEDIDLITTPAERSCQIKADPGQIEQVIMNLAVNARDAMPKGGKLTIETIHLDVDAEHEGLGPFVGLRVTDTGVGMSQDVLSHMFEPFFTTKEQGKGTGLGLSTVYGITTQSGGHIHIDSEPGRGTTFLVLFPLVDTEASATRTTVSTGTYKGSETILLVEDDDSVRMLAGAMLRARGYRVLEASDGRQGLEVFRDRKVPIDLLLTDVIMPRMRGPELAAHVSAESPGTKIAYMSGYVDDAFVRDALLEVGKTFIQKPFTSIQLAKKVRQALKQPSPAGAAPAVPPVLRPEPLEQLPS